MKMPMKWTLLLGIACAGLTALWATAADEPAKTEGNMLLVTDNGGKVHKLKTWKFTVGTRHLSWLAPHEKDADPKDKPAPKRAPRVRGAAVGPEALEFRDDNSTNLVKGVLTLIPLERIRSLEFDNMNETVKLTAATGPKADDMTTLTGVTKFKDINKIAIEAEVDKGELGIAEVKFLGGVPKGVNELKFPAGAKVEAMPEGRKAFITTKKDSKGKTEHEVHDLRALYRIAGGETVSPLLFFKKTIKIDLAKLAKIIVTDAGNESAWALTIKGGDTDSLSLLKAVTLDGKPAVLEGFIGRVPEGYKLFPVEVIEEVQFDAKVKKFDASIRRPGHKELLGE